MRTTSRGANDRFLASAIAIFSAAVLLFRGVNTALGAGGSWATSRPGQTTACSLGFTNTAADDYRLSGSDRGVDWAPAEQHYGP
jgi:hypothetical protein